MEFSEKFVAFVDVLGFKGMLEAAETGHDKSLSEILEYLAILGTPEDEQNMRRYGPSFCPEIRCNRHNLDFKITQISDCVIVSSELSPKGLINLVGHCWAAITELLTKGIMCRGYITKGKTGTDLFYASSRFGIECQLSTKNKSVPVSRNLRRKGKWLHS